MNLRSWSDRIKGMSEELDRLTGELGELDRELLELVARRTKLASTMAAVKHEEGLPMRDYRQERDVVVRARSVAEELSLSPKLAEDLVLLLIRAALAIQERDSLSMAAGGSGKRALVIGGAGKMGGWFVSFLRSQGFVVEVADPRAVAEDVVQFRDWKESDLSHDVIVLASPLLITNEILLEMAERPPQGLVLDVGSLKSPLRTGLAALAQAGASVTTVHPMFGPDTELLSGRHVIFVDVGNPEATARARDLFSSTMAVQVAMDLESHDRLIAYVLGLSHALNIVFFTALAESGEAAPRLATLSSPTFDDQLAVSTRVANDNPRLYFEIQSLNDYGAESLSALMDALERLRSVVRAGDEKGFEALMARGKDYLSARGR